MYSLALTLNANVVFFYWESCCYCTVKNRRERCRSGLSFLALGVSNHKGLPWTSETTRKETPLPVWFWEITHHVLPHVIYRHQRKIWHWCFSMSTFLELLQNISGGKERSLCIIIKSIFFFFVIGFIHTSLQSRSCWPAFTRFRSTFHQSLSVDFSSFSCYTSNRSTLKMTSTLTAKFMTPPPPTPPPPQKKPLPVNSKYRFCLMNRNFHFDRAFRKFLFLLRILPVCDSHVALGNNKVQGHCWLPEPFGF